METTVPILICSTAAVLLCLGALLDDRRTRGRRRAEREEPLRAIPLLHSINDDRCIGCEACIDVCPTEVLDLFEHKVRVARFSDCVQCEQCANACPTQALVMYREGTTPRMLTVPELDEHFQTGVPGQYLIGEVAGKPLVKNAANLGRAVIEHIARALAPRPAADHEVLDVVIVGSGPGGLSAGLTCIKHKLSCLVLEKEHVISSTVSRYPKGKHFMAEPCTSQNVSYLPVFDGTKEELVAAWQEVVVGAGLPIQLGEAVETVSRGDDGVFTIKSTVGTYRTRAVVLATGLRGKPRLLVVPGANLEKVQSLLDDPAEFAGEAVLVVGGGDSAVEGAMALADAGATVTLSYRGDGFKRCKQGNQKRLAEMTASQRLTVLLESNVACFTPDHVTITLADKSQTTIANQRAFVLIGADTPVAWLETNHVRFVERPHLYALGSTEDTVRRFAPDATECPRTPAEALAVLLDRPAPRSPGRHVQSVVEHLYHELREVVTSVSAVFRLPEPEPPRETRRARAQTPAHGVAPARASSQVIPASRLTAGRPGTAPAAPREVILPELRAEPAADAAPLPPLRPRSPQPRAATRPGDEPSRPLTALRREATTDAIPTLRTAERSQRLASRTPEQRADEIGARQRTLDESTGKKPPRKPREQRRRATTMLPRVPETTTVEIRSLPALEQEALRLVKLRCADDGATMEIDSLPAREQQALQLATQRCADEAREPRSPGARDRQALPIVTAELPDDGETEEIASLKMLGRAAELALPSADPLDNPTEIDMPSLRALERSSEVELSSLRTLEASGPVEPELPRPRPFSVTAERAALAADSGPHTVRRPTGIIAAERAALAADSGPHTVRRPTGIIAAERAALAADSGPPTRRATDTASAPAVPAAAAAVKRPTTTASVSTSAPHPPTRPTRPSAIPPPIPRRAVRPSAIPPPIPKRPARFPRGSTGIATHPSEMQSEPLGTTPTGDDQNAKIAGGTELHR